MQFIYHQQAGDAQLIIKDETYQHLYKSRRTKQTQLLYFRNLQDDMLYQYRQIHIDRKSATLSLEAKTHSPNKPKSPSHLILGIIDSKNLQKALPFLNELGVGKLTLFYADYSQKNEKIDLQKLEKILINSSQQCGRSDFVKIECLTNLEHVLSTYENLAIFDFGGEKIKSSLDVPIIIGPEGGFSPSEREKLQNFPTFSTKENLILKSESACIYIASLMQVF